MTTSQVTGKLVGKTGMKLAGKSLGLIAASR